jgi:hypothetical protein
MHFDASRERTWEVLSEPREYGFWVTGAHGVHEAEGDWPAPGATFAHTQGVPPLVISDTTSVVASDPPRMLELEARVRPLLIAHVRLVLEPNGGSGCLVRMDEWVTGGLLAPFAKLPGADTLVRARNVESLRRLRRSAES